MTTNPAFVTGSHAYGVPTRKSDVDLVVFMDDKTKDNITLLSDECSYPIKYGNINIIAPTTQKEYDMWRLGTSILVQRCIDQKRRIPKEEAIATFDALRVQYGLPIVTDDSGE
jgi:hypothetical protein